MSRTCFWCTGWSRLPGDAQALFSLNLEPAQGLPRVAKGPRPHRPWGPESFLHVAGHQWLLQSAGTRGNISASHCSWLLPLAPWGMRMVRSAALLQKAFLESSPAYAAEKDCYPSHELRSCSCQELALQRRTLNVFSAQAVAVPGFEGCLAAISLTLLIAGLDSADVAG